MIGPIFKPLISHGEPSPLEEWWPVVPECRALLACDHASSAVPIVLKNLGLSPADLGRHIALDIGAAALTRKLAVLLQVPAVLSNYSRLVVDCNRHLDDPSAFSESSDGVVIPANRRLTVEKRGYRADALYWPYHAAIAGALARLEPLPALVAIHSFTPCFNSNARPWQVGVLWKADARISAPLLDALRADECLCVGDNEPYSGRHPTGYTIEAHAESRGLPHVSIEVRQDMLLTPAGVSEWAALLAKALRSILTSEAVRATLPRSPFSDSIQ